MSAFDPAEVGLTNRECRIIIGFAAAGAACVPLAAMSAAMGFDVRPTVTMLAAKLQAGSGGKVVIHNTPYGRVLIGRGDFLAALNEYALRAIVDSEVTRRAHAREDAIAERMMHAIALRNPSRDWAGAA